MVGSITTRSPTARLITSAPILATTPTISWPGISWIANLVSLEDAVLSQNRDSPEICPGNHPLRVRLELKITKERIG